MSLLSTLNDVFETTHGLRLLMNWSALNKSSLVWRDKATRGLEYSRGQGFSNDLVGEVEETN